jgi:hypothetical protein
MSLFSVQPSLRDAGIPHPVFPALKDRAKFRASLRDGDPGRVASPGPKGPG